MFADVKPTSIGSKGSEPAQLLHVLTGEVLDVRQDDGRYSSTGLEPPPQAACARVRGAFPSRAKVRIRVGRAEFELPVPVELSVRAWHVVSYVTLEGPGNGRVVMVQNRSTGQLVHVEVPRA